MDNTLLDVQQSDEWWFKQLYAALNSRERRVNGKDVHRLEWFDHLWSYYVGDPELPRFASDFKREAAREVLRMGRANYSKLAVDSLLDRCRLKGVNAVVGDQENDDIDDVARKIMAVNAKAFQDAFRYAAAMGEGYVWVGGGRVGGLPIASAEDPRTCVTINDPLYPDVTVAALKLYKDSIAGFDFAHVALPATDDVPARIRIARRKGNRGGIGTRFSPQSWEWVDELSEADQVGMPVGGAIPVQDRGVLVHRLDFTNGMGLFEANLDLLNRINNMIVDRLWISKFQTFRQRALEDNTKEGDDDPLPNVDEDGKPIDYDSMFESDPDALWRLPQGIKIWESQQTDLNPVLLSVRDDTKEFAAVTRTPLYVFTPDAVSGSAEGASLAREGQVFHAEALIDRWTSTIVAIASDLLIVADQRLDNTEIEAVWLPAERNSMQSKATAATAAKATGVPWEGIMADFWQLDPATIARYKRMRNQDLIYARLNPVPETDNAPKPPAAPTEPAEPAEPAEPVNPDAPVA